MTEEKRRLVLFCMAAIFTSALLFKGHAPGDFHGGVAFFHYSSSGVIIRVTGTSSPGIYSFPAGSTIADVIRLTAHSSPTVKIPSPLFNRLVHAGDVVDVTGETSENVDVSVKSMNAGEMILLGVPLSPDRMTCADWQLVPGIGAKTAETIQEDRQKYGDFRDIQSLERVPGMGEKKLGAIRKYF